MAEEDDEEEIGKTTRVAWALQRRRKGRTTYIIPLEVGTGRIDPDGNARLFLDREPKGGYGGYIAEIVLVPRGVKPSAKVPQDQPHRPESSTESDGSNGDDLHSPHQGDAARALTARR
jgi:hypothetical protein